MYPCPPYVTFCHKSKGFPKNSKKKNSVKMSLETIFYSAPQLWNLVWTEIEDALLYQHSKKIKSCKTIFSASLL